MATSINMVTLVGHLGRAPEVRHTQSGTKVANMTIATSKAWDRKDGTRKEQTVWHKVVAWGKLAELCEQMLHKGQRVAIQGELYTETYTGKDGAQREKVAIKADQVVGMQASHQDGPRETGGDAPGPSQPQEPQRPLTRSWDNDRDTDDLPF